MLSCVIKSCSCITVFESFPFNYAVIVFCAMEIICSTARLIQSYTFFAFVFYLHLFPLLPFQNPLLFGLYMLYSVCSPHLHSSFTKCILPVNFPHTEHFIFIFYASSFNHALRPDLSGNGRLPLMSFK